MWLHYTFSWWSRKLWFISMSRPLQHLFSSPVPLCPPTSQGQLDSLWTTRPVLSTLRDPGVTRGQKYCSNPLCTHREAECCRSSWKSFKIQHLDRNVVLLPSESPVKVHQALMGFFLSVPSPCSRLFGKVLHFQSGEAGGVQKSFWGSKWKDILSLFIRGILNVILSTSN